MQGRGATKNLGAILCLALTPATSCFTLRSSLEWGGEREASECQSYSSSYLTCTTQNVTI